MKLKEIYIILLEFGMLLPHLVFGEKLQKMFTGNKDTEVTMILISYTVTIALNIPIIWVMYKVYVLSNKLDMCLQYIINM